MIRLHNREDGPLDLTGGLYTAAAAMVASDDDDGGGNVDPQQQQRQPSVTIPGDGGGGGEQDGRLHKGEPPPCARSLCPSVSPLIPGLVCSCARSRSLTFVGFLWWSPQTGGDGEGEGGSTKYTTEEMQRLMALGRSPISGNAVTGRGGSWNN